MVIGLGVALAVGIVYSLDGFLALELKTLDARFLARGEGSDTDEVVVVGIDDVSFRELQRQWPWPRAMHARLVDELASAGARAIVFDILFMDPSREGPEDDLLLAEAARRAGNVIFGQKLSNIVERQFRTTALEQPLGVLRNAAETALVNHQPDVDMFARRSYLAMRHQDKLYPALSLAAVAMYLGRDPVELAAEVVGQGFVAVPFEEEIPSETEVKENLGELSGFDASPPGFDPSSSGFDPAPPGFDPTPPGFDASPLGFDASPPGFDSTPPAFDETPPRANPPQSEGFGNPAPGMPTDSSSRPLADTDGSIPPVPLINGGPMDGTYVINFRGGVRSVRTIPYYQVLEGTVPEEFLRGKIVFVGAATVDLEDHFATPFLPMGPMPGVEVHAHAAMTLLRGDALKIPHPLVTLALIGGAAIGTALVGSRLSAGVGFLVAAGGVAGIVGYSMWTFSADHVWFQMVPPVVATGLSYTLMNAYRFAVEERERRRVQNVFGRYVSQDVVEQMLASGDDVPLGGVRQRVTVMFSDIRGFTSLSERLEAEDVVRLLNDYFGTMTGVIFEHRGMIDKFMGDAIMAVFGAPLPEEDDALRAVKAAVGMRKALLAWRKSQGAAGMPLLDSGIGLNTAEVIVGNIGSRERMEYTVIGDGVNLAARLEEMSKEYGGGILIAEGTYEHVAEQVVVQPLDKVAVRGRTEPVQIYKVLGLRNDEWRDTPHGQEATRSAN